jgi:hypothetical protein
MRTRVFMLAAAIALCAPAAANAATVPVQRLNGPFAATNNSVIKTPDGVHFGVYAEGNRTGGSLLYSGANGQSFGSLTALGYTYSYTTSADLAPIATPYLRVLLDDTGDGVADHVVMYDPSECGAAAPAEDEDHTVDVTAGDVRVDNDGCGVPGQGGVPADATGQTPFATIRAAHAGDTIVGILVTQGFSGGQDLSAQLRDLTVDGTTFAFDVAPVGTPGPAGPTGAAGTTTIVQVPIPVAGARPATDVLGEQAASCKGDDLITLHAPLRAGQRFLSARATLRGKRLTVKGRSIRLDLRARSEGNYDVRIVTRYRTKSGRVVTSVTHRVRSVACA